MESPQELVEWLQGANWPLIALAALLIYYVGFPLAIFATFRQQARPTIETFVPADPALPKEVRRHFRSTCDQLMPLGFEYIKGMFLPRSSDNVMAILILLVHRQSRDAVIAVSMYLQIKSKWHLKTSYVEYSTRFADGTEVNTINSRELSSFPPPPNTFSYRLPSIQHAGTLFKIHSMLTQRHGNPAQKVLRLDKDFKGNAAALIADSMIHEFQSATRDGYLRPLRRWEVLSRNFEGGAVDDLAGTVALGLVASLVARTQSQTVAS